MVCDISDMEATYVMKQEVYGLTNHPLNPAWLKLNADVITVKIQNIFVHLEIVYTC